MSTDMRGVFQPTLFAQAPVVSVAVPQDHPYRVLSENLPWMTMAEIANRIRSEHVDIHNGRRLDIRLHLGPEFDPVFTHYTAFRSRLLTFRRIFS